MTGNCFDEVHEFRQLRSGGSLSTTMSQPLMGSATPDATKVRLKLHFSEEIRVLVVNKNLAFEELLAKLREQYDRTISFRYMDEEGDLITVRCEDDWQEALSFYMRTNTQTFKVFLDDANVLLRKSRRKSPSSAAAGGRLSLRMVASPTMSRPSADRTSLDRNSDDNNNAFSSSGNSIMSSANNSAGNISLSNGTFSPQRGKSPIMSPKNSSNGKIVSLAELKDETDAVGGGGMRWQLGEKIGSGAFGQVYKVLNAETGELFAMKQVKLTQETSGNRQIRKVVESLMQEIELMQELSHPNIVRYFGSERRDDTLNIFMEFVSGGSIASMLQKFSAFPEKVTASFTKQILEGLTYLHGKRIVHRDLKGERRETC